MARLSALSVLGLIALSGLARADEPPDAFFEMKIRPVLATECLPCHGGKKTESGLKVDSREALLQGGDRGPAIVAGDPRRACSSGRSARLTTRFKMPPEAAAARSRRIAAFAEVDRRRGRLAGGSRPAERPGRGAQRPRTGLSSGQGARSRRPTRPAGPSRPIDRFIAARRRAAGLRPVAPADRRTLIRRVTFDLIGLPPTPEEVAEFLERCQPPTPSPGSSTACSPRRITASDGAGTGWTSSVTPTPPATTPIIPVPEAVRYRDYIIDAFNRDKPYDQFVREQLAGDILAREAVRRRTTPNRSSPPAFWPSRDATRPAPSSSGT